MTTAFLVAFAPAHPAVLDTLCGPTSEGGNCEGAIEQKAFLDQHHDVTFDVGEVGSQNSAIGDKITSDSGGLNIVLDVSGGLIALIDIARLYEIEHAAGGRTVVAVMRGTGVQVELARDLNIQVLARVLDPTRGAR